MIEETIENIEARLQETGSLREEERAELLKLLANLKDEVSSLSVTREEQAKSITHFAQASTHEATREERNQALLDLSVKGLSYSVEGLEVSHPRLAQIVNRIAVMLSNIGI